MYFGHCISTGKVVHCHIIAETMALNKLIRFLIVLNLACATSIQILSAQYRMTLDEAIATSRSQSVMALEAKHSFVST